MPILEVQGLIKYYGRRKVVDGVDFDVDVGEVVGLLGKNGAGKTTSFRMATGQITPNEGRVFFAGNDVTALPMYRRARLGMGYLSQETSVFRKLNVEQNILAILEAMPKYRSLGRKLTRAERHAKTSEVLEKFGLTHLLKNNASRLSGGEKRRLEIARCLVCDPLLILLDEPFTGIDPTTIEDIQTIIRRLRDQGIGIVAIKEYLGNSFLEDGFGLPALSNVSAEKPAAGAAIHHVVEQEKVHRLIERLRAGDAQAAADLLQRGPAVLPALMEALERRDVEMRRLAYAVLQRLLPGAAFDPYAPEGQRRQQIALLREKLERKAG